MEYKNMKIEDIIEWCQENNQVDWLKETVNKTFPTEVEGEVRKISFIELKLEFVRKFIPELAPKAKEKISMYDRINSL
jgi:hypothetical protein